MRRKKRGEDDGYDFICAICEDFGELLCCDRCRQGFHLGCVGLENCPSSDAWLCGDCSQNKVRCFDCKEFGSFKENAFRCGIGICGKIYHGHCIQQWDRPQPKGSVSIVCPHHYCDICWNRQSHHLGQDQLYRCLKCPTACHEFCMPDGAGLLEDIPGFMLCAKHNEEWKRPTDEKPPTKDVEVAFGRLPLPRVSQDFKFPVRLKVAVKRLLSKPAPYTHIRRNIYLVKRPRKKLEEEKLQCSCHASQESASACNKDCICGMLFTSCSTSCKCGDACSNVPFQKRPAKKIVAARTVQCGWGLKVDEDVRAGDFLVEYVGEVIDDEACEKRLWAMKEQGESNFYMCEISRDMVIDATFKGNLSRFINHSCSPNCELQKWDIEGEIRIGVFATQDIRRGQYVSYDYQFVQFGMDQLCHCGASDCRGQLGKPQKQKVKERMALRLSRSGGLLSRRSRQSKLYRSFSIGRGFSSITGMIRGETNTVGEALKVLQAGVHYRHGRGSCVGLRVKVWWPLDQKFYHGKIVHYDPTIGKHQIMYDDGQEEDLCMTKERWEFEQTLPSQRTRSRSPVLDKKSDEPVSAQNGGLSGLPEQMPAVGEKIGDRPTAELDAALSSFTKNGYKIASRWRGRQSLTLERKRDVPLSIGVEAGHSPGLNSKDCHMNQREWIRTRSQAMQLVSGQPTSYTQKRSSSPKSDNANTSFIICKRQTRQRVSQAIGAVLNQD